MAFPSTTPTKVHIDQSTDSPASARTELATLIDLVILMIDSYAEASGICDLDGDGEIPVARIPAGAGSLVDSDLLDGQHGAYYRDIGNANAGTLLGARFADSSHGIRAGAALHAVATRSVNGFMSAADKVEVDSIPADIAAAVADINTTETIGGLIADMDIYDVGSYMLAQDETAVRTYPGGTRAGQYLRPAGYDSSADVTVRCGTGVSGTWQCMGYSKYNATLPAANSLTLWLRIS